jgi:hypothetical protein
MAAAIPTSEPTTLRAGDTWSWLRSLADYPATSWTLAYTLINAAGKISITAAASGSDHLVTVAADTTAAYAPGTYRVSMRATSGSEAYSSALPDIEVLPNLAAQDSYDDRSHAVKMVEAIESALEGKATGSQIDMIETTIGDRAITRKPELLKEWRDTYRAEAADEARKALIAAGKSAHRAVLFRF